MGEQLIYDSVGHVIGRMVTLVNGDVQVYNATGQYLGFAAKAVQMTYDSVGRVVAQGFAPAILLKV
jgi:hypothetical protein